MFSGHISIHQTNKMKKDCDQFFHLKTESSITEHFISCDICVNIRYNASLFFVSFMASKKFTTER